LVKFGGQIRVTDTSLRALMSKLPRAEYRTPKPKAAR
jgi:hypothetical protein